MYQTRRKTGAGVRRGSRVDRRRTRLGFLGYLEDSSDSTSDSGHRTSSTSSHSDSDNVEDRQEDKESAGKGSDAEEACVASWARRKRTSCAVITGSSSDSDSDEVGRPVRKVLPKKRLNLQRRLSDSDTEAESDSDRGEREKEKRKERRAKLLELSKRRRERAASSICRTTEHSGKENEEEDDDDEDATRTLPHSSEEEMDSDSLKDFIVDDEEQTEEAEGGGQTRSLLSRHLPEMVLGSQLAHFELVVKALLINALDQTFLKSLYDGIRKKRYAREMKNSLEHLDQRSVKPRLENLKQRSRWSERYKERVECYPDVQILLTSGSDRSCEACELHRHTRFHVHLSGQLYDDKTLQEDTFMPNDTQVFWVGAVCASRTEVYHQLKHFKYHLFRQCQGELEKEEEAPVKDMASRTFARLRACGWIKKQYENLEDHLNKADFFQEEKLD